MMAGPASDARQGRFEAVVGLMLESLEAIFIESVVVEHKPRIVVAGVGEVELAFGLTYTIADQPHTWLIECECHQDEGSGEAVKRLIAVSPARPEDRLIFLYHLNQPLGAQLRRALEAEKIDQYSLKEFGIRLDEVNIALAADSGLDKTLFRLELMKSSRRFPALRAAFSRMRVAP